MTKNKKNDEFKLELMDWKHLESTAEQQIRGARLQLVINRILHKAAIYHIKLLGGQTNKQINEEHKRNASNQESDSTQV